MTRVYLDHAATTPMRPEAIAAMADAMHRWANPSSPHAEGRAARAALEDARARIKAALEWDGALIFTSGASEALSIALNRAKAGRRIVSAVEHDAVFRAAPDAAVVPVRDGAVDTGALAALLAHGGRAVVAVQAVNSETGTGLLSFMETNPAVDQVRAAGGLVVADCSQTLARVPPGVDFAVVSAHKLGGPPGIGALLVRDLGELEPIGGHEFGYRQGTENLPAALGFAAAIERAGMAHWQVDSDALSGLKDDLARIGEVVGPGRRSAHILAVAMPHLSAAAQLIRFDALGFAVSAGSACSSGTLRRSRALAAFGVDEDVAARTIRVSFGWNTTPDDLAAFARAWRQVAGAA